METPKLNPNFDDLKDPETFIQHEREAKKVYDQIQSKNKNPFPVDVFPDEIQQVITATNESLNFPIDFIGASILYAVSVAVGNTHKIEVKTEWQESAVLYLSIVGNAGTNKSHPVKFALKPIEQRDDLAYQQYQRERQEYDTILNLTKTERGQQGFDQPTEPAWQQSLVSDFTPEALTDVHKFNKRGVGVYADELASWFKNFNRYNKGSEEQFWLSVWSGAPIRINRKTSEPIYIQKPFISVVGTIQPGVLDDLASNRTENGFLDRILFVMPDGLKKPYWNETVLDPVITENWQTIIKSLLDMPIKYDEENKIQPEILQFTPDADQYLREWQKDLTNKTNEANDEVLSGINAKIETYAIRLALILQLIQYACGNDDKQAVGIDAVKGALKLTEYFKNTAIKVRSIILNDDPLIKLPTDKQDLYTALPDDFATGEGVELAKSVGIPERTFKRFIRNKDLFDNYERGKYEKRY